MQYFNQNINGARNFLQIFLKFIYLPAYPSLFRSEWGKNSSSSNLPDYLFMSQQVNDHIKKQQLDL
jgi:hypothetical protein